MTLREAAEAAYERGWIEAACWAKRDDLCSDVGSPAYIADREPHLDAVLADITQPESEPSDRSGSVIEKSTRILAAVDTYHDKPDRDNRTALRVMLFDMLAADAPQALGDLTGVKPCCGEYSTCCRPCTPRGRWEAQQVAVPPNLSVGSVSVSHWRGVKSMENIDFQLHRDLPDGTHLLYLAAPQPAYVPLSDDLVLLVWRLAASLRRAKPGSEIAQQAIDFINRKGLTPSPLRQAVRGKT